MSHSWSVVTVTYNSESYLSRHWAERSRDYEWIVVDNGSTDNTLDIARRLADTTIVSGGNFGFSIGNNIGLRAVSSEYTAFVNPDVSITGDWMGKLEESIEFGGGLVAPQLLNVDGTDQENARGLPFLSAKIRNRLRPSSASGAAYARSGLGVPTYCAWAMGAAIAGRTDFLRKLGGWDERYFLYYEDHEIGLRSWQRGAPVILDPRVRWLHDWQRATTRAALAPWKAEIRSLATFYRTHPELLMATRRTMPTRLRKAGYDVLIDRLWTSAFEEDQ